MDSTQLHERVARRLGDSNSAQRYQNLPPMPQDLGLFLEGNPALTRHRHTIQRELPGGQHSRDEVHEWWREAVSKEASTSSVASWGDDRIAQLQASLESETSTQQRGVVASERHSDKSTSRKPRHPSPFLSTKPVTVTSSLWSKRNIQVMALVGIVVLLNLGRLYGLLFGRSAPRTAGDSPPPSLPGITELPQ